jgi:hypothetical protein
MSLRSWCLVLVLACLGFAACGSESKDANEPQTAREKMRREAKRNKKKDKPVDSTGKSWGKWRYTGDRAECHFRRGQKCFKTEASACASLRCKKPTKCQAEGAAPAEVSCK